MDSNNSNANGMAVAYIVLGIASIPTICCCGFGLPLAALGIIFALLSRHKTMTPTAKVGFGLSLGSLILTLILIAGILIIGFTSEVFQNTWDVIKQLDPDQFDSHEELEDYLNDYLDDQLYDYSDDYSDD